MIKAAIVDDEQAARDLLQGYIKRYAAVLWTPKVGQ